MSEETVPVRYLAQANAEVTELRQEVEDLRELIHDLGYADSWIDQMLQAYHSDPPTPQG